MISIEHEKLKRFIYEVLISEGVDEFSSRSVSNGLSETSLRGTDSHGVRLFPHYLDSAINGRKNPKPNRHRPIQYTCRQNGTYIRLRN